MGPGGLSQDTFSTTPNEADIDDQVDCSASEIEDTSSAEDSEALMSPPPESEDDESGVDDHVVTPSTSGKRKRPAVPFDEDSDDPMALECT